MRALLECRAVEEPVPLGLEVGLADLTDVGSCSWNSSKVIPVSYQYPSPRGRPGPHGVGGRGRSRCLATARRRGSRPHLTRMTSTTSRPGVEPMRPPSPTPFVPTGSVARRLDVAVLDHPNPGRGRQQVVHATLHVTACSAAGLRASVTRRCPARTSPRTPTRFGSTPTSRGGSRRAGSIACGSASSTAPTRCPPPHSRPSAPRQAQIGVFVNVFTRAPTVLAMTAASLAQIAPGRAQSCSAWALRCSSSAGTASPSTGRSRDFATPCASCDRRSPASGFGARSPRS